MAGSGYPSGNNTTVAPTNNVSGPTLLLIWEHFIEDGHSHYDEVSAEDLCARWFRAVSSQNRLVGSANADTRTMTRCLTHIAPYICPDGGNHTVIGRWLHALLCCCAGSSARVATRYLQGVLEGKLKDSNAHLTLRSALEGACGGHTGRRRLGELLEVCVGNSVTVPLELSSVGHTPVGREAMTRLIGAFGFTGRELVTFPQLLALCFGRFEVPVSLHLYDLSSGVAETLSRFEAIWHSGVVVFGREYFYNGRPVFDKPGESDFGKVKKVVHLGWSFQKQDELHSFVIEHLQVKYTPETYDVMKNNCNHFSDEILTFLLGKNLPDEILHQEERIFEIPGMRFLWPAVQHLITSNCCYRSDSRGGCGSLICDSQFSQGKGSTEEIQAPVSPTSMKPGMLAAPFGESTEEGSQAAEAASTTCSTDAPATEDMDHSPDNDIIPAEVADDDTKPSLRRTRTLDVGENGVLLDEDIQALLQTTRERNAEDPYNFWKPKSRGGDAGAKQGSKRRTSTNFLSTMFRSKPKSGEAMGNTGDTSAATPRSSR